MAILPFLVLFSLLIFVHEGGHFLLAKLSGVGVEEFGFGYPPRVWGKRFKGTLYSINLIPFGGFARIKGMERGVPEARDPDSFATQPIWKRVVIITGGILGNFILGWMLFILLFAVGNPTPAEKVLVEEVNAGSPAEEAGIVPGDYVLSLEGEKVETATELVSLAEKNAGRSVRLEIEREGKAQHLTATPRVDLPEGEGPFGFVISSAVKYIKAPLWQAPFTAFVETVRIVGQMIRLAGRLVRDVLRGKEELVGGPVAILALTGTYVSYGVRIFIQFIALLSVNLVIVNLFPIPALDGGRLLFIAAEVVRGRRISPRTEVLIDSLGFAFIIVLMVLISIHDIQTFF